MNPQHKKLILAIKLCLVTSLYCEQVTTLSIIEKDDAVILRCAAESSDIEIPSSYVVGEFPVDIKVEMRTTSKQEIGIVIPSAFMNFIFLASSGPPLTIPAGQYIEKSFSLTRVVNLALSKKNNLNESALALAISENRFDIRIVLADSASAVSTETKWVTLKTADFAKTIDIRK